MLRIKRKYYQQLVPCSCPPCAKKNPDDGFDMITRKERDRHTKKKNNKGNETRPPLLQLTNSLRQLSLEKRNGGDGPEQGVDHAVRATETPNLFLEISSRRTSFATSVPLRTPSLSSNCSTASLSFPSPTLRRSITPNEANARRTNSDATQPTTPQGFLSRTPSRSPSPLFLEPPPREEYIIQERNLIPAFSEVPPVRLLYLQTLAGYIFGSRTVLEASSQLTDGLDLLELAGALPVPDTPGFIPPARTYATARRRLRLDPDEFIERRPICTACFKHYPVDVINAMETPACTVDRCKGLVFKEKRTAEALDNEACPPKRIPIKIHCYSSLVKALSRFLLRQDFVKYLRDTSNDSNRPPLSEYDLMHDIHDAESWNQLEVGLKRRVLPDGSVRDDEAYHGSRMRLVDCDLGLNMTFNLDWFGITDSRPHSAGAIYGSFNNLHRSVRYLKKNVYLAMTIPGPTEPSLEQMNHLLEPLVEDLKRLYSGIKMKVFDSAHPRQVHVVASMQVSDLPASRKFNGAASHSHKRHPCNMCHISKADINRPAGYDAEQFQLKSDSEQLQYAEKWQAATTERERKKIFNEYGVRFSVMNNLPGWLPISCSPVDFMHNFYGIVHTFWSDVIKDGHLLDNKGWEEFESLINRTIWPSGIGRLPDNISKNRSLQKADQWRRMCNVQAIFLWLLWRAQDSDDISTLPPELPRNTVPPFTRDLKKIYDLALWLSVAEHILATHSICMADVHRAQLLLQRYCEESLNLNIHLKPNHHFAMHYEDIFKRFGPAYVTWVFAFERFNGELEKVNLNGRAEGEMELTLLRDWIMKHRMHELGVSLPLNISTKEIDLLKRLGVESSSVRGTFETTLATFKDDGILKPKPSSCYSNLRKLEDKSIYGLLLQFSSQLWPHLDIVDDFTARKGSIPFLAQGSATSFPFIIKGGIRYGSSTAVRTQADSFACVDCGDGYPVPCKLLFHFEISLGSEDPVMCSVIQQCSADDVIPSMPWDLYATDIGSYIVYANRFNAPQVVQSSKICNPVAVIPITSHVLPDISLWAVVSFDRTGIEFEQEWLDELQADED